MLDYSKQVYFFPLVEECFEFEVIHAYMQTVIIVAAYFEEFEEQFIQAYLAYQPTHYRSMLKLHQFLDYHFSTLSSYRF